MTAGHIAQQILEQYPILPSEKPTPTQASNSKSRGAFRNCKHDTRPKNKPPQDGIPSYKRENKFWETRIYTRIVSWGREFNTVKNYLLQNVLEAAGLIFYVRRDKAHRTKRKKSSNNIRFNSS